MPGKKKVSRIIQTLCVMAVVIMGYLAVMPDVVKAETHTFDFGNTANDVTIENGTDSGTIKITVDGSPSVDNIQVADEIVFKGGDGSQIIDFTTDNAQKVTNVCLNSVNIEKIEFDRAYVGDNSLTLTFKSEQGTNHLQQILLTGNASGSDMNLYLEGDTRIELNRNDAAFSGSYMTCTVRGNGCLQCRNIYDGDLGIAIKAASLIIESGTLKAECVGTGKCKYAISCDGISNSNPGRYTQNGGTVICKVDSTDGDISKNNLSSTALNIGYTGGCTINGGLLELITGGGLAPIIQMRDGGTVTINPPITSGIIGTSKATAETKTAAEIMSMYDSTSPVYCYLHLEPSPSPTPTPEPQKKEEKEEQPQQSNKKQEENPDVLTWSYPTNPSGILVVKEQQGFLCRYAMKAATPFGYREAFSFNMLEDGKASYNKKTGTFTLGIPTAYQKSGRIFAIIGIDRNGNTKVFTDLDTSDTTFTTTLDMEGYAFLLIYTDTK